MTYIGWLRLITRKPFAYTTILKPVLFYITRIAAFELNSSLT